MRMYLKAAGTRGLPKGASNWMRIRHVTKQEEDSFTVLVMIKDQLRAVDFSLSRVRKKVKFATGKWPFLFRLDPCMVAEYLEQMEVNQNQL